MLPAPSPPAAQVIVIPPPSLADENRLRLSWGVGAGVPEGLHGSLWARRGSLGAQLNVGVTSLQSIAFSAAGRWYVPKPLDSFFVGAGAMLPLFAQWNQALAFFDVGWQWRQPHWFLEVAAGPAPFAWGGASPADLPVLYTDWPRMRLSVGQHF